MMPSDPRALFGSVCSSRYFTSSSVMVMASRVADNADSFGYQVGLFHQHGFSFSIVKESCNARVAGNSDQYRALAHRTRALLRRDM